MSVGVSTWIIIGEKSIEPNLSALREKQNLTMAGSLGLRAEDGSRYSDTYRLQEGAITYVDGGFVTMTNPDGGAVTGKWVFTADRGETATHTFTSVSVSGLTQYGTGTAYADRYQILGAISVTFIPDNIADYNEYTTTITNQHIYPVARIGTTAYGTIEKALAVGGTVYVLPGANPTIRENCAIASGSKLILYTDDTDATYGDGSHRNQKYRGGTTPKDAFIDSNATNVKKYRKSNVTIADGKKLTVNGEMFIAGIIGSSGQGIAGATTGIYSQLTLNPGASIESNGLIDCMGYIKEGERSGNGSQITVNSGNVWLPFVVYDYCGGTQTTGAYNAGDVAPFSVYDMPNIQSKLTVKSSATVNGYADLYASDSHNYTEVKVISSSNAVVNLASGSYLVNKFTPETFEFTATSASKARSTVGFNDMEIYGDASMGAMTLKVSVSLITANVSTENVLSPMSWKLRIRLMTGSHSFPYKVKFLTGASLTVEKDASATFSKDTIFYQTYVDATARAYPYPAKDYAKFIVNGWTTIAGPFGGYVETKQEDAILEITTNTLTVSSKEVKGSGLWSVDETTQMTITETAKGDTTDGGVKASLGTNFYKSNGSAWSIITNPQTYTVKLYSNYDNNYASETDDSYDSSYSKLISGSLTRKDLVVADPDLKHYEFGGWYTDASLTTALGNDSTAITKDAVVKLYAKWTPIAYTIEFMLSKNSGVSYETIADKYPSISFIIANNKFVVNGTNYDMIELSQSGYDGYQLDAWYIGDNETKITAIPVDLFTEMIDSFGGTTMTLYGLLNKVYTVTLNNGNGPTGVEFGSFTLPQGMSINDIGRTLPDDTFSAVVGKNSDPNTPVYFDGEWYYDSAYTQPVDLTKAVESDTTLYAKWKNKLKITYYRKDDTTAIGESNVDYFIANKPIQLRENAPTYYLNDGTNVRTEMAFSKWKINGIEYAGGYSYTGGAQNITASMVCVETLEYKVTFASTKGSSYLFVFEGATPNYSISITRTNGTVETSETFTSTGTNKTYYLKTTDTFKIVGSADKKATGIETITVGSVSLAVNTSTSITSTVTVTVKGWDRTGRNSYG